jgi:hypothetical protein
VVGIGGGVWWAGAAPSSTERATVVASSQIQLEPTSSAGANPFMGPVGQDQAGVTPPAGATGEFSGDTAGLFAEAGDQPSCDARRLQTNLGAEPTKAAAWAEALGITSADIPGYVASLNPVVLRADTAVTSYGYTDNTFSAYPAVLQAGTAVFVNGLGEPRVKCFSGNPLTAAQTYQQPSYTGPSWEHFAPTTVTYVRPAPVEITDYTVVNIYDDRPRHWPGRPHWPGENGGYCKHHPDSPKCPHPGGWGGGGGTGGGKGTGGGITQAELDKAAAAAKANAETAAAQASTARTAANAKNSEALTARQKAEQLKGVADAKAQAFKEGETKLAGLGQERTAAQAAADANPTPANIQAAALAQQRFNDALGSNIKLAGEKSKAEKEAAEAGVEAGKKEGQSKNAEAAARSAEGSQKAAEERAQKASEAATKGPSKTAGTETKNGKNGKEVDPAAIAKEGEPDTQDTKLAGQQGLPGANGGTGKETLAGPAKPGDTAQRDTAQPATTGGTATPGTAAPGTTGTGTATTGAATTGAATTGTPATGSTGTTGEVGKSPDAAKTTDQVKSGPKLQKLDNGKGNGGQLSCRGFAGPAAGCALPAKPGTDDSQKKAAAEAANQAAANQAAAANRSAKNTDRQSEVRQHPRSQLGQRSGEDREALVVQKPKKSEKLEVDRPLTTGSRAETAPAKSESSGKSKADDN